MERIDRPPDHPHDVDEIALSKMTPGEAYVAKQLSINRQDMRWVKEMIVRLNNAVVEHEGNVEPIPGIEVRLRTIESLVAEHERTFRSWIEKFKSPLVMASGFFGLVLSATIGVLLQRWLGGK